jgi:hypothetical protein
MNKPSKPKREKPRLNLPARQEDHRLPDTQLNELRLVIKGAFFKDLIESVLATTLGRYPSRDPQAHIQYANLASREAVNQFISDLFTEVETPTEKEEEEEID